MVVLARLARLGLCKLHWQIFDLVLVFLKDALHRCLSVALLCHFLSELDTLCGANRRHYFALAASFPFELGWSL